MTFMQVIEHILSAKIINIKVSARYSYSLKYLKS